MLTHKIVRIFKKMRKRFLMNKFQTSMKQFLLPAFKGVPSGSETDRQKHTYAVQTYIYTYKI